MDTFLSIFLAVNQDLGLDCNWAEDSGRYCSSSIGGIGALAGLRRKILGVDVDVVSMMMSTCDCIWFVKRDPSEVTLPETLSRIFVECLCIRSELILCCTTIDMRFIARDTTSLTE